MSQQSDFFIWDCERCATKPATYEAHLIALPKSNNSINASVKFYHKHYCSNCVLYYQASSTHILEILRELDPRNGSPKKMVTSETQKPPIQVPTTLNDFL